MNITIGIEGPVLAGKSTVVRAVTERLHQRGIPCLAVPCFVEAAIELGMTLPDITPRDVAAQVAAVQFYLNVDRCRRPVLAPGVVFLDRTCWTLLAHTAALAATGVVDAVAQVQLTVDQSLKPVSLIYLDVANVQQLSRARARPGFPSWLLDREFNAYFRAFFQATQDQHAARWINANQGMPEVVDDVETHILRSLCIIS